MLLRSLIMTPWRKGPLLILRRPGVFLALSAAAFVAALPAASAPMFVSSARNATLHRQLAAGCASNSGAAVPRDIELGRAAGDGPQILDDRRTAGTELAPPGLAAPVQTLVGSIDLRSPGTGSDHVVLVSRDGFADHVTAVQGPVGKGLWLPDRLAARLGVHAGDSIDVSRPPSRLGLGLPPEQATHRIPVAAVYVDLRRQPDSPYWCSIRDVYRGVPGQDTSNSPVYDTVLADLDTLVALGARYDSMRMVHLMEWAVAAPDAATYEDIERLAGGLATMQDALGRSQEAGASGQSRDVGMPANDGLLRPAGLPAAQPMNSRIAGPLTRARLVHRGLLPPVAPITAAGVVVGLLVVGAAAVFWVQRRRRELAVLAAHGATPASLGGKAVLEAAPALLTGALVGAVTGWLLVREAGPDPVLSASAPRFAILGATATVLVGAAIVGIAAGLRTRTLTDQAPSHAGVRRLGRLPWELLLVAAAAVAWSLLDGERQINDDAGTGGGSVAIVPARLLVVPILAAAGLIVLGCRIGVLRSRRRAAMRRRRQVAGLLARRRLTRHAMAAAVLAAATAIPIALAVYGATVTGSIRSTIEAEARLQVGADLVASLSQPAPVPAALAGRGAAVTRLSRVQVDGVMTDLLAVDPKTFADVAGGSDLHDLTGRLGGGTAYAMPVVPTGTLDIAWGGESFAQLTIESTGLLPGGRGGYPTMITDIAAIPPDILLRAEPELWVRGDAQEALAVLAAADAPMIRYTTAEERYANTVFEPVTFTFAYLVALSLLTGLVALVGLLLYLESRTPSHRRSYVLLHRMGLRGRTHRRAVFGELAVPLGLGLCGGLAVAAGLVGWLGGEFDLNTSAPPGAVLTVPIGAIAATTVAVILTALAATAFADARTRGANPSSVLRDSD